MRNDRKATAAIKGHPIHYLLVPVPIASFILAFASDVAFLIDGSDSWAGASKWLIAFGLAGAGLAAIAGFTDFLGNARIREFRDAWLHLFANVTIVLIESVNLILRLADQRMAGSPGIVLSGAATLLLVFSGWKGGNLVYRHGVGQMRE
jgi:uncharacterized membrane protein